MTPEEKQRLGEIRERNHFLLRSPVCNEGRIDMRFNLPMIGLAVVLAAVVNLIVYYTLGPTAALIEAIPGGLLIGLICGLYPSLKKNDSNCC